MLELFINKKQKNSFSFSGFINNFTENFLQGSIKTITSIQKIGKYDQDYDYSIVDFKSNSYLDNIESFAEVNKGFLNTSKQLKINLVNEHEIISLLNKYTDSLESFIQTLKYAREIFGDNRELTLKPSEEISEFLCLTVRQQFYSEEDNLNDLIFKVIQYSSKQFTLIEARTGLTIDTDYNVPEYINNEQPTLI